MSVEQIETDLLIVGSGFAGLWAAIAAREAGVPRVGVVDKAAIAMSSQSRLCAGATIYCLPEDDAEVWLRDIVEANGFLSRQPLVAEILETSYQRLCKLEEWGVSYPAPDHVYIRIPSRGLEHVKMMVMPRFRDRTGGSAVVDALRQVEELRDGALPDLAAIDPHELAKLHETRNMIRVAEMFLRASLARTESRGSHFRADHPEPDNERWLSWINLRKEGEGGMRVETEPVPLDHYPIQPRADRVSA